MKSDIVSRFSSLSNILGAARDQITPSGLGAALIIAFMTLCLILGSVGQSMVDSELIVQRPTHIAYATPTLYPTLPPVTHTETAQPPPHTPTLTPRSPLIEQCTPPAGWVAHQVQANETLVTLAWRASLSVYTLMDVNCLSVANVQPGDIIYLPPRALQTPTATSYPCGPPSHWRIYYVQPGDTLFRLALIYGTTIEAIRQANCMVDYTLYTGKGLYLPPTPVIQPTSTSLPPTWTVTPSATPTPGLTVTPLPTVTLVSPTPTMTSPPPTPTLTVTTPTATPPLTPIVTLTATPTLSATATATLSPTPPITPTATTEVTTSPTPTASVVPTMTTPPIETATFTPTPTPTVTQDTSTPTPTSAPPTVTPTPTIPTPTATPTEAPTMPLPTATPTPVSTATVPPTASSTPAP